MKDELTLHEFSLPSIRELPVVTFVVQAAQVSGVGVTINQTEEVAEASDERNITNRPVHVGQDW